MQNFNLNEKISSSVSLVDAYVPGEQPQGGGWVKLNTNEFPYPPTPRVREAILEEIGSDASRLRLYPEPLSKKLRAEIGRHFGVGADCAMAANGSDDALNIAMRCFCDAKKPLASLDPSYSLYPVLAKIQGAKLIQIPFKNGFEIDFDAIFKCSANTFFFTNPNAPTGKGFPVETVEKIADGFGGMVLVDEAYAPFADHSAATLVKKYPNLIVTGTMSKGWGLAGMRLGWAIANPEVIEILDRVRDSYNLDRLAQAAGIAALSDEEYHAKYVQEIKNTRRITEHFLDSIGWKYIKSSSNFILLTPNKNGAECPEIAAEFAAFLRSKKILARYFASDPSVNMSIRLTIGTPEQMQTVMDAITQWTNI